MKLFLLRHGDRSSGYGDVPLSQEGLRQAQDLAAKPELKNMDVILSSPKIRTQQTVKPLADMLGITVQIENALDQRKSIETQGEFIDRILKVLSHMPIQYPNKNVLLCSHSDWLQMAILNMPSPHSDNAVHCFFSCADVKILNLTGGLWEVV